MQRWKPFSPLMLALLVAFSLKLILVISGSVPFNSDEAIVALAARHILQGARPIFFYGQAYMGTIDSYMVALAFTMFGENVFVMRLVEMLLYVLYVVSLWGLARRILSDTRIANVVVILAAIPPVLISTYTTVYYGTYGETILFGNIILWLGYEVIFGNWQRSALVWTVLGVVAGLAFWTFGLIGVYILPVAILGLWKHRFRHWKFYLLCGAGFILGSGPWWVYNLQNDWAAVVALTSPNHASVAFIMRVLNLFLFNLPALLGVRFPWRPEYVAWPLSALILILYSLAFSNLIVSLRSRKINLSPGAALMLGVFVFLFIVAFIASDFGVDISGRYLLPLFTPLLFIVAIWVYMLWLEKPRLAISVLTLFVLANLAGTWLAATSPDGLTTQFDPISSFDNQYDQALIDFLNQEGLNAGYANYWVTYRLAFLSGETLIYSPKLPYKESLSYTNADVRIPEYAILADQSPETALITTKHPKLDDYLGNRLSKLGIDYSEKQIGPYHIFYDLSDRVSPEDLGFGN